MTQMISQKGPPTRPSLDRCLALSWRISAAVVVTGVLARLLDRMMPVVSGLSAPAASISKQDALLFGGYAGALLAVAFVYCLVVGLARVGASVSPRLSFRSTGAALAAGAAVYPFFRTGEALSAGEWIGAQPYAFALPFVCALSGAALFAGLFYARQSEGRGIPAAALAACAFGGVLALALDAYLFPALYPSFHRLAFGLSITMLFLFVLWGLETARLCLSRPVMIGVSVAALLAAGLSLHAFATLGHKGRVALLGESRAAAHLLSAAKLGERPGFLLTILSRIAEGRSLPGNPAPGRGCHPPLPDDWNIVLIVMDAMRADALPPNRTRKPKQHARDGDTPFLDRLAAESVRFRYAYSPSNNTAKSMPSIFTGLTPPSLRRRTGEPVARLMKRAGRKPIAVVNDLFSLKRKTLGSLLDGFEKVDFYPSRRQERAVREMLAAVDDVGDAPFFAWFHFYALHNPYFAEGGVQRDGTDTFPNRYRKALRWVDGEVARLFDGFAERQLLDRTVFVLSADHGEGLGDHGLMTHGSYIFEEETRVPLYVRIPGVAGATVSSTVSLIDLVATLTDMVGRPAAHTDGVSLCPLIRDPRLSRQRNHYLENGLNNHVGVVRDRAKLIYTLDTETMYRFDLEKDRREKRNLFRLEGELDQHLLFTLIEHRPDLFVRELDDERVTALYRTLLDRQETLPRAAARLLRRIEVARGRP